MIDHFKPCIRAIGPPQAKIAFVGEAPGETEEQIGLPLVGASGQEFTSMLQDVGIERRHCYLTNVLFSRPPNNKLEAFLVPKGELPDGYSLPPILPALYLHPSLVQEVDRLRAELLALRPNLVVPLGNTACWALLGRSRISSIRGVVAEASLLPGQKVLPTYHPAGVMRNWSWRVVVLQDLLKAKIEEEFPEIRRPERRLFIDPTLEEALSFLDSARSCPTLSCDIETAKGQITSIAFATQRDLAMTIPFWDRRKDGWSYWTELEELTIWELIAGLLSSHPRVLFQNGLYDVQYLWRIGIPVPGFSEDTMLLHHSRFPELPKSLEFMGSIYTNERSWKSMRTQHGASDTKREE